MNLKTARCVETGYRVGMKYNRLGEVREKKDQLETVHVLEYDKLGRLIHDRVTAFGTGVDQAIKRISRSYEVRGMLQKVTSCDHATVGQGSVVNQAQFAYNSFGQLVAEYQSHAGEVNVQTTPKVQYAYADSSANHIRPTSLTYPDGRVTTYDYGATGGTDHLLSRISALKHGSTVMVEYGFLGLETIVRASYTTQPGVELTYLKLSGESDGDAGDRYTGLDRFGRVVDQRWIESSTGTPLERVQYGFDRGSNRLWRDNLVAASGQDEYYTYDGLYQLAALQRGDLNVNKTGISGTPAGEESFAYDPTGNWHGSTTAYVTRTNGTTDLDQNRTHNAANELTGITTNTGPAWVAPVHDRAGNMTTSPQPNAPISAYTCTYDAWNRLVAIAAGGSSVATYQYDGVYRQTQRTVASNTRHFYYSDNWQVLEERLGTSSTPDIQFVWGRRSTNDLLIRDRSGERLYVLHDHFHPRAILDGLGAVVERYGYDAFGNTRIMNPSWAHREASGYDWETRYAGHRWDMASGLYLARARYYHSGLGRFLMRDPIERSLNLYSYVSNNSVNSVDPTGLQEASEVAGFKMPGPLKIPAQIAKILGYAGLLCMASNLIGAATRRWGWKWRKNWIDVEVGPKACNDPKNPTRCLVEESMEYHYLWVKRTATVDLPILQIHFHCSFTAFHNVVVRTVVHECCCTCSETATYENLPSRHEHPAPEHFIDWGVIEVTTEYQEDITGWRQTRTCTKAK